MAKKLISIDDSKTGEAALPDAVNTALRATYGPVSVARGDSDIAVRALRSDLDCGYSTCFGWHGDSTGDSYGETTDSNPGERTPVKLAKLIGEAYPDYHILARRMNPSMSGIKTLQAKAAGREYMRTAGRTARWQPSGNPFPSGTLDLAVLVAPDTWSTGANQLLIASTKKQSAAGVLSDSLAFEFGLWANGSPYFRISENGTAWTRTLYGAAVPGAANGQPMWVRVVIEITPGTPGVIKKTFYYSTDDTATWTANGGTETLNTDTFAMNWDATNFLELGGAGWSSVGSPLTGKIMEVVMRDGVLGAPQGPCLPRLWERFGGTGVTYGGAPTLYLPNSSWSGSTLTHHMDPANFGKMTPNYGQVVTFFNMSHNQGGASGQTQWVKPYEAWVDAVIARQPSTTPVAVLQNPHTSAWPNEASFGISHQLRLRELAALAGRRRWGVLDLYREMSKDPRGVAALLLADGLHPNSDGYDVAAKAGARMLGITS